MSYFFRIYPYPIKHYLFSNKHLTLLKTLAVTLTFYQRMK